MAVASVRSSFDLWGGIPTSDLVEACAPAGRSSLQIDARASLQLDAAPVAPCLDEQLAAAQLLQQLADSAAAEQLLASLDTADLLALVQQEQLLAPAAEPAPSLAELDIDVKIQQLLQMKQALKRKPTPPQVILEGMPFAAPEPATSLAMAPLSPMQPAAECLSMDDGWGHLAAARAAARPVRHSIDIGAITQHMAALDFNPAAAAASLNSLNAEQLSNDLTAAALGMGSSAFAAPSRNSFCGVAPLPSPSAAAANAANAAMVMQSALYMSATPAAPPAPLPAACQALDCSSAAGVPAVSSVPALAVPAATGFGRPSMSQPLLGDRGAAAAQAAAAAAAGWGAGRRASVDARRASVDVRRGSFDTRRGSMDVPLARTPEPHAPPRKAISALTSASSTGSCSSSASASSCSSRGSPMARAPEPASRRASIDAKAAPAGRAGANAKPIFQAPKWAGASWNPLALVKGATQAKGTGVFVPGGIKA